eukprot:TRINITY_DN8130_c0_g1_i1.p1 TRINITY_DN8130_c0_g1~~TRINITY_DN8130_c0_g1_i1.p1  ORF type:complete len:646 (+),score=190.27 TRINITY_DN8130_c0_g1_i1:76-1938(+)
MAAIGRRQGSVYTPSRATRSPGGANDGHFKYIVDTVHGHMTFEECLVRVIDTPEFQRLRQLKQLGTTHYVSPDAVHTRFSHSLGVAHMAGVMMSWLRQHQHSLGITPRDELLVKLAGLCHDLGHGPLSHAFEEVVADVLKEEGKGRKWSHEDASEMLFDVVTERAQLTLSDAERELVKALIRGVGSRTPCTDEEAARDWAGAPRPMGRDLYLFQIVANKQTGLDVDKFDYLLRDSRFSGYSTDFNAERVMRPVVRQFRGEYVLAYYAKDHQFVHDTFYSRFKLHRQLYGHSAACATTLMAQEILWRSRHYLRIAEAITNPKLYVQLTDSVLDRLDCLDPDTPPPGFADGDLAAVQRLLQRIKGRQLFRSVLDDMLLTRRSTEPLSLSPWEEVMNLPPRAAKEWLIQHLESAEPALSAERKKGHWKLWLRDNSFTNRERSPVLCVPFYDSRADPEEEPHLLTEAEAALNAQHASYWERRVRLYVTCEADNGDGALSALLKAAVDRLYGQLCDAARSSPRPKGRKRSPGPSLLPPAPKRRLRSMKRGGDGDPLLCSQEGPELELSQRSLSQPDMDEGSFSPAAVVPQRPARAVPPEDEEQEQALFGSDSPPRAACARPLQMR